MELNGKNVGVILAVLAVLLGSLSLGAVRVGNGNTLKGVNVNQLDSQLGDRWTTSFQYIGVPTTSPVTGLNAGLASEISYQNFTDSQGDILVVIQFLFPNRDAAEAYSNSTALGAYLGSGLYAYVEGGVIGVQGVSGNLVVKVLFVGGPSSSTHVTLSSLVSLTQALLKA